MNGPRLQDAEFFTKIDTTRSGLEAIPEAVATGDFTTARRLFAAEVRRTLQPDRFLRIKREFRGHSSMREGETIAEAAERILDGELISCSTPHRFEGEVDWFVNPTFNQYREWTWQLSRHPEWAYLAERYRETGDERLAAAFVRFFRSWVRQALVPEDAPGGATLCWRTIEAGIRMGGAWQWALHSFYRSPHVTDDVLVDWYKSVWEHGWRLRNFHRTGNWLIMEMNGLAQIGILYPQFVDAPAWKTYAFDRMVDELAVQVYPDGFQYELSTGYHQVVIRNYQWLMDVCTAYDEPVPEAFRAGLERMHAVNVQMMMPDGRLPDLNDGSWLDVPSMIAPAVLSYPERSDFRWAHTRGEEGRPPDVTSLLLPYAGYAALRTDWSPDAVWAFFDGGPFGYGHQHEDKLNVLLHAYGRLLLTEGGNYAYDSSEMRRYVLSTRAHNTIRVDGQDQNRRLHFRRPDVDIRALADIDWYSDTASDEGFVADVVAAVYDEGYGPEAARTVTHRRKVIFVKAGALGSHLLVIDRLEAQAPDLHTYQILWHLNTDSAEVDGLTVRSTDPGQPNLAIIPATQPDLNATVVRGQEIPEWQGWTSIKHHQQGDYVSIPTAIYTWQAKGPARLVTLLYPSPPDSTCPIRAVEASANPAETAIRLILSDGDVVIVNE